MPAVIATVEAAVIAVKQPAKLPAAVVRLAVEKTVARDIALQLELLPTKAIKTAIVPVVRLRGRGTAEQNCSAQRGGQ